MKKQSRFKDFYVKYRKMLRVVPMLAMGLILAWSIETGQWKNGVWALIIFSFVMATFRIALGWNQYKAVVNMGAEHLHLARKVREQERKEEGEE